MSDPAANELVARIDADLKQAMRDKNETEKLTLRSIKTALTEARVSGGAEHELTYGDVMAVLQKEAKRRRDAAAEYEKAGNPARAQDELAEMHVIERYLPQQLSEAEVEEIARRAIAQVGATSPKEMGAVMQVAMPEMKGRADGKLVNQVVRRLLGG